MRLIPLVDAKATPLIAAAQKKDIYWEVEVLQKLSHPNIVRIQELIETSRAFGMTVNYDSPKTLAHFVQEVAHAPAPSSTKVVAYNLFRQLSSAVSFLHKNRIVHCDLTLDNIIWCEDESRIIVTNLSMSKMIGFKRKRKTFTDVQTFGAATERDLPFTKCSYRDMFFAAPELLKKPLPAYARNRGITDVSVLALEAGKVDVYSCGIILVKSPLPSLPLLSLVPRNTRSNDF
jgi:serine/threonine protein kinase